MATIEADAHVLESERTGNEPMGFDFYILMLSRRSLSLTLST
jgi:hypothetical protein